MIGLIFILVLVSCQNEQQRAVPDDLLPENEFISLLIDLEIMEAYYEQVHKRPILYKTTLDSASRQIIADHNTTEVALKNTMNYYSAMPDSLFYLYEKALDSINTMVITNKNAPK